MKKFLTCCLISVLIIVILTGCDTTGTNSQDSTLIKRQFEKKGWFRVTLSPTKENDNKISSIQIDTAIEILNQRFEEMGITGRIITANESGQITIDIINNKSFDLNKVEEVIDVISVRGYFTTQEIDENSKDRNGVFLQTGRIIFDGSEIVDIGAISGKDGKADIVIKLNEKASKAFEEVTEKLIGQKVGFYIDDDLILAPTIVEKIPNGEITIPNQFTREDSLNLINIIQSGALPYELILTNINQVQSANK